MIWSTAHAQLPPGTSEVDCLARNIYHEARGESNLGQRAVAWVTLNRAAHASFPEGICNVVNQPHQFSWVKMKLKVTNRELYSKFQDMAETMIQMHREGHVPDDMMRVKDALYFDSLVPKRARNSTRIGNHNFYMR